MACAVVLGRIKSSVPLSKLVASPKRTDQSSIPILGGFASVKGCTCTLSDRLGL